MTIAGIQENIIKPIAKSFPLNELAGQRIAVDANALVVAHFVADAPAYYRDGENANWTHRGDAAAGEGEEEAAVAGFASTEEKLTEVMQLHVDQFGRRAAPRDDSAYPAWMSPAWYEYMGRLVKSGEPDFALPTKGLAHLYLAGPPEACAAAAAARAAELAAAPRADNVRGRGGSGRAAGGRGGGAEARGSGRGRGAPPQPQTPPSTPGQGGPAPRSGMHTDASIRRERNERAKQRRSEGPSAAPMFSACCWEAENGCGAGNGELLRCTGSLGCAAMMHRMCAKCLGSDDEGRQFLCPACHARAEHDVFMDYDPRNDPSASGWQIAGGRRRGRGRGAGGRARGRTARP